MDVWIENVIAAFKGADAMSTRIKVLIGFIAIGLFIFLIPTMRSGIDHRGAQAPKTMSPKTISDEEIKREQAKTAENFRIATRKMITEELREPSSAKFRNDTVYKGAGGLVLCGELNAKNGFGGYTGYQPFIASPAVGYLVPSNFAKGEFQKSWAAVCRD